MDRHINLIRSMPVSEQAFTSKKSTWEKYIGKKILSSDILAEIFDNKEDVEISRQDLLNAGKSENLRKFIVSTILWGYPAGMRGNHFENISNHLEKVEACLLKAKRGIEDWDSHYATANKIEGLGLSTYTKLLYFIGADVNKIPCVILDQRVINAIRKGAICGLESLDGIATHNAAKKYPEYLMIINEAAKKYGASHGGVEMFIFSFGLNIKEGGEK